MGLACLSSDSYWPASWGLDMAVWVWGGCCPHCSFPVSALYLESFPGRWRRRVPALPEVLCHLQWVGNWGMWALQLLLKSFEPKWRAASLRDPRALLARQYCPFSWVSWGGLPGLGTSASCCCFDKKTVTLECVREEHQARWFSLRRFIRVQLVSRWPQPLHTGSREASKEVRMQGPTWSWWGLQTPHLCQVQHLCAWRLFVLLG